MARQSFTVIDFLKLFLATLKNNLIISTVDSFPILKEELQIYGSNEHYRELFKNATLRPVNHHDHLMDGLFPNELRKYIEPLDDDKYYINITFGECAKIINQYPIHYQQLMAQLVEDYKGKRLLESTSEHNLKIIYLDPNQRYTLTKITISRMMFSEFRGEDYEYLAASANQFITDGTFSKPRLLPSKDIDEEYYMEEYNINPNFSIKSVERKNTRISAASFVIEQRYDKIRLSTIHRSRIYTLMKDLETLKTLVDIAQRLRSDRGGLEVTSKVYQLPKISR